MPEQEPSLQRYHIDKVADPIPHSRWVKRGPDSSELGHPVPISFVLARSGQASLGITGFLAYSNGFRFAAHAALREPADGARLSREVAAQNWVLLPGGERTPMSGLFLLRLHFSDHRAIDNSGTLTQGEDIVRSLNMLGGSGGGTWWNWDWFVAPLPPRGAITFECEWPQFGLEGKCEIGAAQILSAAKKSQRFFA